MICASGGSKGGARDVRLPGSKFFQFHTVFGKIWQNRMLAPPSWGVGAPTSGKSWIRHCVLLHVLVIKDKNWNKL